jgi:diguanylate cyclase (GGDEF)-like protein/PAS domain S-box-containing protein
MMLGCQPRFRFNDAKYRRALGWVLLLPLVGAVAMIAYLLNSGYRDAIKGAETTGANLAAIIQSQLDASLRRTDVVLTGIVAEMDETLMAVDSAPRHQWAMDRQLDLRARRFPEVAGLRVFGADGRLLYSSDRQKLKRIPNSSEWDVFLALRDAPDKQRAYSRVFIAPAIEKPVVAIADPIRSSEGRFLGIALAFLDLDHFSALLAGLDVGRQGIFAIRRSDDSSLILRSPTLEQEINMPLAPEHPVRAALTPGVRRVSGSYVAQNDGVERIFSMHVLEDYPFYVGVALGKDEVLAGWQARTRLVALVGLPLILLLVGMRLRLARSERERNDSEERFRDLFEQSAEATLLIENDCFIECNAAARAMLRMKPEDNIADIPPAAISPEVQPDGRRSDEKSAELLAIAFRAGSHLFEWEHVRADGERFTAEVLLTEIRHRDRHLLHVVWRDISQRKRAEARVNLLATAFRYSGEAIVITDAEANILEVNNAFARYTGYGPEEVIGRNPKILSAGRTAPETYREMWAALAADGFWQGELWDRHQDGHSYPKLLTISAVRDEKGRTVNYIGNFTDITERKAAEERIQFLAHHDALTRLPNRTGFGVLAQQTIVRARRDGSRIALLFIDIDRFKDINDTLGHHSGDDLLVEVSKRLKVALRESDIVARFGGDEFVVVLPDVGAAAVVAVLDKLVREVCRSFRIDRHEFHPTLSIGISLFPDDGNNLDELMRNADLAMYKAKAEGRNQYQFYTPAMNHLATERLAVENSLRRALENGEFFLHYQPQVAGDSGRVIGVEALVRWQSPERGLVPPDQFIPIAEESGLIDPLGDWILREAVRQLAAWREDGISGIQMAVNLSARQLLNVTLVDYVRELFAEFRLSPGDLELEVTESMAMHKPEQTISCMHRLREVGVQFAVDDFGTGYSSLAYLKRLPIDRIKLDRSFVMDIEHDPNDATICAATIAMAHGIGLEVVAEGVETEAQLAYLLRHECESLQGYYFSRPLGAADCAAFIRNWYVANGNPTGLQHLLKCASVD